MLDSWVASGQCMLCFSFVITRIQEILYQRIALKPGATSYIAFRRVRKRHALEPDKRYRQTYIADLLDLQLRCVFPIRDQ
jgi:hypothetical protein